jgi:hypothetical protein
MRLKTVETLTLTMVVVATMVAIASAQVPIRVRGAIAKVSGQTLTIASRDNSSVEVRLADTVGVTAVVTAALSDIKTGAFVGAAALPQPDGTFRAQEVLIFPESGRGTGEGHYPWDLSPGSTMTNAAVDALVSGNDGTALTLKHKNGETKVVVPPDAPIVTLGPGDKSLLVPGAGVFVPAVKAADGTLSAGRVLVGKDGLMPPM